jgi:hypothetical protein
MRPAIGYRLSFFTGKSRVTPFFLAMPADAHTSLSGINIIASVAVLYGHFVRYRKKLAGL